MPAFNRISSVSVIMTAILQDIGLTVPTAFVGNTDTTISQLLRVLTNIGRELCLAYDWEFLHKEFTITTTGVDTYSLPADYNGFVDGTFWNNTTRLPVIGPVTPQIWRMLKARNLGGNTISIQYRIVGDKIVFYQAPSVGQTLVLDYFSRGWVQDATDMTYRDGVEKDSDLLYFDPRILESGVKLRWRQTKGFDTTAAQQEADSMWETVVGRDTPAPTLSLAPDFGYPYLGYNNIPDTGYGS